MKKGIFSQVRKALQDKSDEKTRNSFQRFFKENVKCHGVKSAEVVKIAEDYFKKVKNEDKKVIFSLCEEFLKSGYCEEAWIAANWAYFLREDFESDDFWVFERWIDKYIDNWAECDTLCNHTVGTLVEKYPSYIQALKKWARSKNLWMRRAAAVTLIIPARDGKFLNNIFEIADILLCDTEDMVQKGYGWMLKEASRIHTKEVFDYVVKNKDKMPRTALRYAIEKMPQNLRKKAME
jgi:3-methyladenine DNA glycosylase AlkD